MSLAAAVSAPATDAPRRRRPTARSPKPTSRQAGDPHRRCSATRISSTQRLLGIPGNRDLFLNAVNWLAQQENLISIRPRDPEDRRVTLTARSGSSCIFWLSILIIPGLILAAGVQTWWRRR